MATANFAVDPGETDTCVFINTQAGAPDGTITILKQATPTDSGEVFEFIGDLGNFSLRHSEFIIETRTPGIYAVSETVPAGWQLDRATCSDSSPVSAIDLAAGESVTCTFVNSVFGISALAIPVFSRGGFAVMALLPTEIVSPTLAARRAGCKSHTLLQPTCNIYCITPGKSPALPATARLRTGWHINCRAEGVRISNANHKPWRQA